MKFQYILGDYETIIPRECIRQGADGAFVYVAETRQGVMGTYELVCQINVTVLDTDEFYAAVSAPLSERSMVIRGSSKPIRADQKVRSQS